MIAIATGVLLAAGAGALAGARTDSRHPTFEAPYGAAAPFGVGYVDGFGEHSPKPSPPPGPSRRPAKPSTITARTSTADGFAVVSSPSAGAPGGSAKAGEVTVASGFSAVYWATSWHGSYEIYVWVHNEGPAAAPWQVKLQLPPSASVTTYWEADGVSLGRDSWQFSATRNTALAPGGTYLFAFEGRRGTGPFRVYSCSVNGISCTSFW